MIEALNKLRDLVKGMDERDYTLEEIQEAIKEIKKLMREG